MRRIAALSVLRQRSEPFRSSCRFGSVRVMASRALVDWQTDACAAFDEIENAHRAVGGTRPGRRFVTRQLNYAYVTLLAARFQGFARTLHSQTADEIALAGTHSVAYSVLLFESLTSGRLLDRQNAYPVAVAKDFERFGVDIWEQVDAMRSGNDERRKKLEALITWRNAIAHHDIDSKLSKGALDPTRINFDTCKAWRRALSVLSVGLDQAAADRCEELGIARPW